MRLTFWCICGAQFEQEHDLDMHIFTYAVQAMRNRNGLVPLKLETLMHRPDPDTTDRERDRAEEAAYEAHREEEGTLEEIEEHERELAAERLADRSE